MASKPSDTPWWFLAWNLVFLCVLVSQSVFNSAHVGHDYFFLAMMAICLVATLVQFVRAFFRQQAQFSIKSLLVLTCVVAVLCSIYRCLGFTAINFIICFAQIGLGVYMSACLRRQSREDNGTSDDQSPTA